MLHLKALFVPFYIYNIMAFLSMSILR